MSEEHVSEHEERRGGTAHRWFLCTDIEGSTALWDRHRAEMDRALARHDSLLAATFDVAGGSVFEHTGDGLPLAIELAAARAEVMTLPELVRSLNDRLRLLTGGRRS